MAVVHERWLRRVNAIETAGGVAVTTANRGRAAVLLDHRHMIAETLRTRERAHALSHR